MQTMFFYFKQHLLKAFFDKIKTYHRKWLFVVEKQVFCFFLKYVYMGFKRPVLQIVIQRSKRFVKILKNMRSMGALQWKKLGNYKISSFFLVFQLQLGYFSLFCKTGFSVKNGSFDAHVDIF